MDLKCYDKAELRGLGFLPRNFGEFMKRAAKGGQRDNIGIFEHFGLFSVFMGRVIESSFAEFPNRPRD